MKTHLLALFLGLTAISAFAQSATQGIYNITSYGAVPDNDDDDTGPIQEAILGALGFKHIGFNAATGQDTIRQVTLYSSGKVYVPKGYYNINRRLVKSVVQYMMLESGGDTMRIFEANSQLYVPYVWPSASDRQEINTPTIAFEFETFPMPGLVSPGAVCNRANWKAGTNWRSGIYTDRSSYPAVIASVIGDKILGALNCNPTYVVFEKAWITTHFDSTAGGAQLTGIGMQNALNCTVRDSRVDVDVDGSNCVQPSDFANPTVGVWLPYSGQGTISGISNSLTTGFRVGASAGEHAGVDKLQSFSNYIGLDLMPNFHPVWVYGVTLQWNSIQVSAGYLPTPYPNELVSVDGSFSVERYCANFRLDVMDSLNKLRGEFKYLTRLVGSGCTVPVGGLECLGAKFISTRRIDSFDWRWKGILTNQVVSPGVTGLVFIDTSNNNNLQTMNPARAATVIGAGLPSRTGGLTWSAGGMNANATTGIAGGQSINGGTNADDDLTIRSTIATPGIGSYINTVAYGISIGTSVFAPSGLLHISGTGTNAMIYLDRVSNDIQAPQLRFRKSLNGQPLMNGSGIVVISADGMTSAGSYTGGSKGILGISAAENWTPSSTGTYAYVSTTATGSNLVTERLRVTPSGGVLVGTTTENTSALMQLSSTAKGFLPPVMTTAQRNAIISPAVGLELFCSDCKATDGSTGVKQSYNGTTWKNYW